MKNENLLDLLKKNGLSERESKVYKILLESPNLTPTQIHNLVGITRTKIYKILSSLLSKNLIAEELIGKKKAYRILNPETSFDPIIKKKIEELQSFKENNDRLISLTSEIYKNAETGKSPYYKLEHLSDPVSIRDRIKYYITSAKQELLIFFKPPYVSTTGEFDLLLEDTLKVRTIWEYSSDSKWNKLLDKLEIYPKDEVRVIDELPVKLFIIDSRVTILALGNSNSKEGKINTIFLDEPIIALFMKEIFESRWKKALPINAFK